MNVYIENDCPFSSVFSLVQFYTYTFARHLFSLADLKKELMLLSLL